MNKMNSFVKEVVAVLKGDDAEATGQRILRAADSALKTQISSLTGDVISLEDSVELAKENLAACRINHGKAIEDRNKYVANLLTAKNELTQATENLECHKEKIIFLEDVLTSLDN